MAAYLGRPAYAVAALLVCIPFADFVNNVWPAHPGSVAWRYAAEGLFAGALPTIALGMLLAAGIALARHSHRSAGVVVVLAWLLVAALVPAALDFALSALQLRADATQDPAALVGYDMGTVRVSAKYVIVAGTLAWIGLAVQRWRRHHSHRETHILVGNQAGSDSR